MNDKFIYTLIGNMALEYRLSLDNICRILNRPTTDETKIEIYENIKKYMDDYFVLKDAFEYLFFYETINQSPEVSLDAYNKARKYISRHNEAIRENNSEKKKAVKQELIKTDMDFKDLIIRGHEEKYSLEDIAVISRYRLKYAISRETFCLNFPKIISVRNYIKREQQLESETLKNRIDKLSDFYLNFVNNNLRKR